MELAVTQKSQGSAARALTVAVSDFEEASQTLFSYFARRLQEKSKTRIMSFCRKQKRITSFGQVPPPEALGGQE